MTTPSPAPARRFREQITLESRRLGFEAVGFARADRPLTEDFARYEAFLRDGKEGEMSWLASSKQARERVDGDAILPGAKTVICLARRYSRPESEEERDPELAKRIARYARGRDYHNGMRKKLRKLASFVRDLAPASASEDVIQARPLCDEEPILERAWAARAGLGFVGKNGLLIVPGVGSMVLLGEVVTTLDLASEGDDAIIPERCGSCTRCLDVCPTNAFEAPFVLDPRRCVSYLTIEHRAPIDVSLREGIGDHLFGCDDCQTICPFNASRGRRATSEVDLRFDPDPRWATTSLVDLLSLDEAGFAKLREGSPLGRATRVGLARNAAIVLGNSSSFDPAVDVALDRAAHAHDSPTVRDAAAWAIRKRSGMIAVRP